MNKRQIAQALTAHKEREAAKRADQLVVAGYPYSHNPYLAHEPVEDCFAGCIRETKEDQAMSTHTPGPWTVGQSGDVYAVAGQWAGVKTGRRVMSFRTGVIPSPEDARLIAAAPELLTELERLVEFATPYGIPLDAARAAIAKAQGEK